MGKQSDGTDGGPVGRPDAIGACRRGGARYGAVQGKPFKVKVVGGGWDGVDAPYMPNETLPPGGMSWFQPAFVTVTSAPLWTNVPFHVWVIRWSPGKAKRTVHPLTGAPPRLWIVTVATKPVAHCDWSWYVPRQMLAGVGDVPDAVGVAGSVHCTPLGCGGQVDSSAGGAMPAAAGMVTRAAPVATAGTATTASRAGQIRRARCASPTTMLRGSAAH